MISFQVITILLFLQDGECNVPETVHTVHSGNQREQRPRHPGSPCPDLVVGAAHVAVFVFVVAGAVVLLLLWTFVFGLVVDSLFGFVCVCVDVVVVAAVPAVPPKSWTSFKRAS